MPVDPGDRSLALPETPPKWPSLRSVLLFTIYNLCLAALFLAMIGVSNGLDVVSGVELDHALLLRSTAPEETASAGTTVSLPHRCPVELDGRYCAAAYRFTYAHAPSNDGQAGNAPASVYLPLYSGNIRVLLNGTPLADSRWTQTALLSVSGPQLVPLPAPMLKDGANDIDIELETPTIQSAFLGPIHVGADAGLRQHFNVSHFVTITLPRLIDGWQIGMGLVMLLIWVARPSDRAYLLFGVILLLHAASSVSAVPVNAGHEFWVRMASLLRIFAGAMAFPFLCLLVGRRPPMPLWVFGRPSTSSWRSASRMRKHSRPNPIARRPPAATRHRAPATSVRSPRCRCPASRR